MRVLVTGASGDFAAGIIPEILGRGHEVRGLSRRPHSFPSAGYSHHCADIRDADALVAAMDGIEAVVHLAWTTHPMHDVAATRAIDVGGTEAVLEAMRRTGVPRLVTASSVMAYGAHADNPAELKETDPLRPSPKHIYSVHKAEAEGIITASGVNALMIRASNIMGRTTTGVTQEGFATPAIMGMKGGANRFQFIHPDDLSRFFADAIERLDWRGTVNLAAEGSIVMREIAPILGKRYVEVDPVRAEAVLNFLWDKNLFSLDPGAVEAFLNFPIVDTTKLTQEFRFEPAWTNRECVEDFARTNRSHVFLGTRRVAIPWRWPWASAPERTDDGTVRTQASDAAGEFDSKVRDKWGVYTAANTSEAYPGPMTPLSLELGLDSLGAGATAAADAFNFKGELRDALSHDAVGSFGHGLYANLSVVYALGSAMPGAGVSAWEDLLFGDRDGAEPPNVEKVGPLGMARILPGLAGKLLGFAPAIRDADAHARAEQRDPEYYAGLTDAKLVSQLNRMHDEVCQAFALGANAAAFVVPVMEMVRKQGGMGLTTRVRGGAGELPSAGLAAGAHKLADMARGDAGIMAILQGSEPREALAELEASHPDFVREFNAVLRDYGHRGPAEMELANAMFIDDPARFLDVIAKLTKVAQRPAEPTPPMSRRAALAVSMGNRFQRTRELARDAAVRRNHEYRMIARELGRRLASRGVLEDPSDVFYLVRAEIKDPPPNTAQIVARRKAERERLRRERPPLNFAYNYEVAKGSGSEELQPGQSLQGTAVSAGNAKGTVRVLTVDSMDDLKPGEVLVTAFTDVGWTPYFSFASAVVVDTGGEMSHAAVVAREFGIPCVVGTMTGSSSLRTGHLVEVDGSTGKVTRVE